MLWKWLGAAIAPISGRTRTVFAGATSTADRSPRTTIAVGQYWTSIHGQVSRGKRIDRNGGRNGCDDCVCFKEKILCKVKDLEAAGLIEKLVARIAELEAKAPRWMQEAER